MDNLTITYYCNVPEMENAISQMLPRLPFVIMITETTEKPNGKTVKTDKSIKGKLDYGSELRFSVPVGEMTVKLGKYKAQIDIPDDNTFAKVTMTLGKASRWDVAVDYSPIES